jgi:predicted RNA-binding Zn-ribbon protein involved in translation (DUF1610 family)
MDVNLTEFGCPECGENNIDFLEFLNDGTSVKCLTCGHTYELGGEQ